MPSLNRSAAKPRVNALARGNQTWIESPLFNEHYPEIRHGFGTRKGAGRRAKGKVDFLEPPRGDEKTYEQCLNELARDLGLRTDRIVFPQQVHGADVLVIKSESLPENPLELRDQRADAVVTNVPELAIGVRTADCVPILLYDTRSRAIGVVHAGWRGTVAGVLERTLKTMAQEFGTESSTLCAVIGPAIGPRAFEVDEPVLARFRDRFDFWSRFAQPGRGGKWYIDLKLIHAYLLASAGVEERSLDLCQLCTLERKDLFYSYRRDGDSAGRMLNFIMLRSGGE